MKKRKIKKHLSDLLEGIILANSKASDIYNYIAQNNRLLRDLQENVKVVNTGVNNAYNFIDVNNQILHDLRRPKDEELLILKKEVEDKIFTTACEYIDIKIAEICPISNQKKQVTAWQQIQFLTDLKSEIKTIYEKS